MLETEYSDATKFVIILDKITEPQLDMLLKLAQLHQDGRVVMTPHPAGRLMCNPALTHLKTEKYTPRTKARHDFIMEAVEEKRERDMRTNGMPMYEVCPHGDHTPNAQHVQQAFKAAKAPYTPKQFRFMRCLRDAMQKGHLYIYPGNDMTELESKALTHCVRQAFGVPGSEDQSRIARIESYILAAVIEKIILSHQQN